MAGVKRAPAAEPEQEEAKKPRAASLCASSPESSASEEDAPARGKDFVGWVDTEIVGHRHECANRGKYRLRETAAGRRLCCCEEVAEAAELCRDGGTLELRRNPQNRYDSNAVQVLGAVGCMLGHLPRDVAAELAPLLDSAKVWVQAEGFEVGRGSPGYFLTLLVHADEAWFAARPKADALTTRWARFKRILSTEAPEGEDEGGCFRFPRY